MKRIFVLLSFVVVCLSFSLEAKSLRGRPSRCKCNCHQKSDDVSYARVSASDDAMMFAGSQINENALQQEVESEATSDLDILQDVPSTEDDSVDLDTLELDVTQEPTPAFAGGLDDIEPEDDLPQELKNIRTLKQQYTPAQLQRIMQAMDDMDEADNALKAQDQAKQQLDDMMNEPLEAPAIQPVSPPPAPVVPAVPQAQVPKLDLNLTAQVESLEKQIVNAEATQKALVEAPATAPAAPAN